MQAGKQDGSLDAMMRLEVECNWISTSSAAVGGTLWLVPSTNRWSAHVENKAPSSYSSAFETQSLESV